MSSRIYNEASFNSALQDYYSKLKHYCPHCLSKNILNINKNVEPPVIYLGDSLFCGDCERSLLRCDLLTLEEVREVKVSDILG